MHLIPSYLILLHDTLPYPILFYPAVLSIQIESCSFLSNPILSFPFQSSNPIHPIKSYPIIISYSILSYHIPNNPILSYPILTYTILSHLALSILTYPNPNQSQPISSLPIVFFSILSHSMQS